MVKNFGRVLGLVAALFCCSLSASAQTITATFDSVKVCPDQSVQIGCTVQGFTSTDSYTVSNFAFAPETVGGTFVNLTDDDATGAIPLPFCFDFYGQIFNNIYIASNGWISFDDPAGNGWAGNLAPDVAADLLPSTAANVPTNVIFCPWKDYSPNLGGAVRYQGQGVAPNRRFVITWNNVPYFDATLCPGVSGTTQIVLQETSNFIETHITTSPFCAAWQNGAGTHGMQNGNGTQAITVPGRNGTVWDATNESHRFSPNGFSPVVNWYTTIGGNPVATGYTINVQAPPTSTWYYCEIVTCDTTFVDSTLVKIGGEDAPFNITEPLCRGDLNGGIAVWDTANLPGPLDFIFLNSNNDTLATTFNSLSDYDSLGNLGASNYEVIIIGSNGNCASATITLTQPTEVFAGVGNLLPSSCFGNFCDGGATGSAIGGTPPYNYTWPGGSQGLSTNTLCSGNNSLTVTDANLCADTINFSILEPTPIVVTSTGTDTICISNSKNLSAIPIGGSPPFTFQWIDSTTQQVISTNNAIQVSPVLTTTYTVSVSDANNCPGPVNVEKVTVRAPLIVDVSEADTICPGDSIQIFVTNKSGGDEFYTYQWTAGIGITDTIKVSPATPRWYFVSIYDGCGTPPAVDSTFLQVGGYPDFLAEITASRDSICEGEHTVLRAKGFGGFGGEPARTYTWNDGYVGAVRLETPDETTNYSVTVSDECLTAPGSTEKEIYIGSFPAPSFIASVNEACAPLSTELQIPETSGPINPLYTYEWNFGDGSQEFNSKLESIPYSYSNPGCYDVSLRVTTDVGCQSELVRKCMINVHPNPRARFDFAPSSPTTLDPRVAFRNRSVGGETTSWSISDPFADEEIDNIEYFQHIFSDVGTYDVKLITTNEFGCADSITKELEVVLGQTFYIPLAFSPNGDDLNDRFGVIGENIPVDGFSMIIFDRWGHELFRSNHPEDMWNGRSKNGTGNLVPIDVYPYVIKFRGSDGVLKEFHGRVTYAPTE